MRGWHTVVMEVLDNDYECLSPYELTGIKNAVRESVSKCTMQVLCTVASLIIIAAYTKVETFQQLLNLNKLLILSIAHIKGIHNKYRSIKAFNVKEFAYIDIKLS